MNRVILSPLNLGLWGALIAVTLAGYGLIPAGTVLPVHWGITGEPDAFLPRNGALILPPLFGAIVMLIFWAVGRFAPPAQLEASRHAWRTIVPALSALFLTIAVTTILIGLGYPDLMVRVICVGLGVMLVVLGNVMPKTQRNGLAGIRLPWVADAVVWQKTQRLGGLLFMAGGFVLLVSALVLEDPAHLFVALLAALLVPIGVTAIYSYRLAHGG